MKKRLIVMVVCAMMIAGGASANSTLGWGGSTEYGLTNHLGGVIDYSASAFSNGITALVQLIWAGANNVADTPYLGNGLTLTNGAGGDDVVVAYTFDGDYYAYAGLWQGTSYLNTHTNGSRYFIRVWEMPEVPGGTGFVHTNGAGNYYYGNSFYTVIAQNSTNPLFPGIENPADYTLDGISGLQTSQFVTVGAIPEPGSLQLLMFLGTAFAMRRRMRKSIG